MRLPKPAPWPVLLLALVGCSESGPDFPLVVGDSPLEVGLRPASVVVADFDGDGALDLATASAVVASGTASVSVLLQRP